MPLVFAMATTAHSVFQDMITLALPVTNATFTADSVLVVNVTVAFHHTVLPKFVTMRIVDVLPIPVYNVVAVLMEHIRPIVVTATHVTVETVKNVILLLSVTHVFRGTMDQ